jgi:hypothetical protein
MLQRGRKGLSRFKVLPGHKPETLPAPAYFGAPETALWNEIIASHGVNYFSPPTRPLLEQFCILSVAARRQDIPQKERIAIALCTAKLASSMRLSQFTSYEKPRRKPANANLIWQDTSD